MNPKPKFEISSIIVALRQYGDDSVDLGYIEDVYEYLPEESQVSLGDELESELNELKTLGKPTAV